MFEKYLLEMENPMYRENNELIAWAALGALAQEIDRNCLQNFHKADGDIRDIEKMFRIVCEANRQISMDSDYSALVLKYLPQTEILKRDADKANIALVMGECYARKI